MYLKIKKNSFKYLYKPLDQQFVKYNDEYIIINTY